MTLVVIYTLVKFEKLFDLLGNFRSVSLRDGLILGNWESRIFK